MFLFFFILDISLSLLDVQTIRTYSCLNFGWMKTKWNENRFSFFQSCCVHINIAWSNCIIQSKSHQLERSVSCLNLFGISQKHITKNQELRQNYVHISALWTKKNLTASIRTFVRIILIKIYHRYKTKERKIANIITVKSWRNFFDQIKMNERLIGMLVYSVAGLVRSRCGSNACMLPRFFLPLWVFRRRWTI